MGWQTERQRATAIHLLLHRVGLQHLWDPYAGPTREAHRYHERPKTMPGYSHGEMIMWRLAWELHNGTGKFSLDAAMGTLDGGHLRAIGSLLVAYGGGGSINGWLADQLAEAQARERAQRPTTLKLVP